MRLGDALLGPRIVEAWDSGRNNFNLIRLFAAWLVIYGHAWAITAAPGHDLVTRLTQFKFAGGVAVDMFFVISGFLIAASLERNDWRAYLASRALRIYPALIVCVTLCVFVLGPWMTTEARYWHDNTTWRYWWVNGTLWSSEYFLPGVFEGHANTAVNGSLWSLPIEARLYLALLLASLAGVLTAKRYTPLWLLALGGAYAWAVWKRPLPDHLMNYIWCTAFFITGTLCWVNRARIRLSWPLLLALLAAAAWWRGTPQFHLPYFAVVAYGTLWLALVPILPMIRHTDLSYGTYLYGWPLAQLVQAFAPGGALHTVLWTTVLVLPAAAASWFLVERPALRLKRRFRVRTPAPWPER